MYLYPREATNAVAPETSPVTTGKFIFSSSEPTKLNGSLIVIIGWFVCPPLPASRILISNIDPPPVAVVIVTKDSLVFPDTSGSVINSAAGWDSYIQNQCL